MYLVFWRDTYSGEYQSNGILSDYFMLGILNVNIAWPPIFYIEVRNRNFYQFVVIQYT